MSYFTAANTGADWIASDGRQYYAQTPMLHDIDHGIADAWAC